MATTKKTKQPRDKKITQQEFAARLRCDPTVVSRLISAGSLTRGAGVWQWVREIYHYFAEAAAGRSTGELDLADERAKLARAQTTKINFDVGRQAAYMETSASFGAVRAKLLAVPHRVKSENPSMPIKAIASIERIILECLRDLAETKLSRDLLERVKEIDDEDFAKIEKVDGGDEPQTTGSASGKKKAREDK